MQVLRTQCSLISMEIHAERCFNILSDHVLHTCGGLPVVYEVCYVSVLTWMCLVEKSSDSNGTKMLTLNVPPRGLTVVK